MSPATPEPASAPPPDLTGSVIGGDFAVMRLLGQGGMGQVYLAEQLSLRRKVALKVLKPELAANETSMKRFRNEAQAVARVTHPNIVQVYLVDQTSEGVHFMVLEFVDGSNLREYLAKKGPPALPLALQIMRQVGSALARAGELGIVHRDIKPENILLTRKNEVKVADFGLSRCFADDQQPVNLTQSGIALGTPLYMSPEQVQGKPVDPRSDIYSFGVTAYHMLSGQPPFRGETAFEVAIQHVQTQPSPLASVRPDLPAELCAIVDKMMAKKPEDRYPTAREMLRELSRMKEGMTLTAGIPVASVETEAPAPSAVTRTIPDASGIARPRRLWPFALFAASLLVAVAAGAGAAFIWKMKRATALKPLPSEEERLLRREVERPTPSEPEHALTARLNLGLFYLQHGRLNDADEFFNRLGSDASATPEVQELGLLGHALVLAHQDRAKDSNEAVLEVKKRLDSQPARAGLLLNNSRLRLVLARALERNYLQCEAAKEPFPPELERFRKPGPVVRGK